ncbi:hypothetical protein OUZ56_003021 [Daphnia magna]|uniref:Uncharacterized protein n=1 Tax=Daphnia magna TaxID=35525 RepID=A0ABR0A7I2_9CRUS|nr:hypothetical protein OUZ56_003021 [Daphnia magna]
MSFPSGKPMEGGGEPFWKCATVETSEQTSYASNLQAKQTMALGYNGVALLVTQLNVSTYGYTFAKSNARLEYAGTPGQEGQ